MEWPAKVMRLLGVPESDERLHQQISKFIRCNGALGVVRAANEVAKRRRKSNIENPWAYCIRVYNGSAARSVVLHQVLYLLENSLRSRVDAMMTSHAGDEWYRDVHAYLPREIAPVFLTDDQFQSVQDRATGGPPYGIQRFRYGIKFAERIPLWGLQAIISHNYPKGPLYDLFTATTPAERLDPLYVVSSLDKIRSARNEVAHHRSVSPELYAQTRSRVKVLLEHLEFDVTRTEERVRHAVSDLYEDEVRR